MKLKNRIVGSGEENPQDILANPLNFRGHPTNQRRALSGAMRELGWIQQVIINKTTGHLIDGHLRVEMAVDENEPTVPVLYVDLSEKEEKIALASLDPIAALAFEDNAMLESLLQQIGDVNNNDLSDFLSGLLEQEVIEGVTDANAEWQDMPEFNQEDKTSAKSIIVHFASEDDFQSFAEILGQKITMSTKSIWHPEVKRRVFKDKAYE